MKTLTNVKLSVENGDITREDIDHLFDRINEAKRLMVHIAGISSTSDNRDLRAINLIANDYLRKVGL